MKVVAIVSGGMDSVTMLHKLVKAGNEVEVLSFDYRQRHKKELECAKQNAELLGLKHKIIDIQFLYELGSNSALTQGESVPEGHYADDNMKKTVVPNRNMILASIAIAHAVNIEADAIALGVHSGDHTIYPDCRPEFISALRTCALIANWKPIDVIAPYLYADKTVILQDGFLLEVDYSKTWTCYNGGEKACGRCGSCQERLEAFKNIEKADPLPYED